MCLIYWLRLLLARFSNYIYGIESSDCRLQVAYGHCWSKSRFDLLTRRSCFHGCRSEQYH
ncbi:hypothetical protein ABFS82_14G144600 [Erythranthe guttata]